MITSTEKYKNTNTDFESSNCLIPVIDQPFHQKELQIHEASKTNILEKEDEQYDRPDR